MNFNRMPRLCIARIGFYLDPLTYYYWSTCSKYLWTTCHDKCVQRMAKFWSDGEEIIISRLGLVREMRHGLFPEHKYLPRQLCMILSVRRRRYESIVPYVFNTIAGKVVTFVGKDKVEYYQWGNICSGEYKIYRTDKVYKRGIIDSPRPQHGQHQDGNFFHGGLAKSC